MPEKAELGDSFLTQAELRTEIGKHLQEFARTEGPEIKTEREKTLEFAAARMNAVDAQAAQSITHGRRMADWEEEGSFASAGSGVKIRLKPELASKLQNVENAIRRAANQALDRMSDIVALAPETAGAGTSPPANSHRAWQERIVRRQEEAAKFQQEMLAFVGDNADAGEPELLRQFLEFARREDLATEDVQLGVGGLHKFAARRAAARAYRERFPDPAELYERIFRRQPVGRVEVIAGLHTLYFRCHNLKDFAWFRSVNFSRPQRELRDENVREAAHAGASFRTDGPVPELNGVLMAENAGGRPRNIESLISQAHEMQHALYDLFRERKIGESWWRGLSKRETDQIRQAEYKLETSENGEDKKAAARKILRRLRVDAEDRAGDEIIAYLKNGAAGGRVFDLLTRSGQNGGNGLYDYFSEYTHQDDLSGLMEYLRAAGLTEAEVQSAASEVFTVEYHSLIRKGIDVFTELKQAGYTPAEIAAMLEKIPLGKWEKFARHLLHARGKINYEEFKQRSRKSKAEKKRS